MCPSFSLLRKCDRSLRASNLYFSINFWISGWHYVGWSVLDTAVIIFSIIFIGNTFNCICRVLHVAFSINTVHSAAGSDEFIVYRWFWALFFVNLLFLIITFNSLNKINGFRFHFNTLIWPRLYDLYLIFNDLLIIFRILFHFQTFIDD